MNKRQARLAMLVALGVCVAGSMYGAPILNVPDPAEVTGQSFDITALGPTDWVIWCADSNFANPPVVAPDNTLRKNGGTALSWTYPTGQQRSLPGGGVEMTYTGDGPGGSSGSTTRYETNQQYIRVQNIIAPSIATTSTLNWWVYGREGLPGPNLKMDFKAQLYDSGGTPIGTAVTKVINFVDGIAQNLQFTATYSSDGAGDYLVMTFWEETGYGSGYTIDGRRAAALDQVIPEIPEPATLLLVGTGALGVFGYARRRMMK